MKSDDTTLQIEVTVIPPKGRKGGQRRSSAGPKMPDPPRIPRTTRLMALAIKFQDMVERGEVRDYADLARLGLVSRARVTQIMNLLNLHPGIQEQLLFSRIGPTTEHCLRPVIALVEWETQMKAWNSLALHSDRLTQPMP